VTNILCSRGCVSEHSHITFFALAVSSVLRPSEPLSKHLSHYRVLNRAACEHAMTQHCSQQSIRIACSRDIEAARLATSASAAGTIYCDLKRASQLIYFTGYFVKFTAFCGSSTISKLTWTAAGNFICASFSDQGGRSAASSGCGRCACCSLDTCWRKANAKLGRQAW